MLSHRCRFAPGCLAVWRASDRQSCYRVQEAQRRMRFDSSVVSSLHGGQARLLDFKRDSVVAKFKEHGNVISSIRSTQSNAICFDEEIPFVAP